MTTIERNMDKFVVDYFNETGRLHPEVLDCNFGQVEELIDAIPESNLELINELRKLL